MVFVVRGRLSNNSFTDALFDRPISAEPFQIKSSVRFPRMDLMDCSPSTKRNASAMLLFPLPFGPTIAVIGVLNWSAVLFANDLNPVNSRLFKYMAFLFCLSPFSKGEIERGSYSYERHSWRRNPPAADVTKKTPSSYHLPPKTKKVGSHSDLEITDDRPALVTGSIHRSQICNGDVTKSRRVTEQKYPSLTEFLQISKDVPSVETVAICVNTIFSASCQIRGPISCQFGTTNSPRLGITCGFKHSLCFHRCTQHKVGIIVFVKCSASSFSKNFFRGKISFLLLFRVLKAFGYDDDDFPRLLILK